MLLCRCEGKNPIACSCNSIRHNEATTTTIAQCIWYWRIGREKRIVDMYRSARRAWQSTILCSPLEHEEIATMTTAKQWKIYIIYRLGEESMAVCCQWFLFSSNSGCDTPFSTDVSICSAADITWLWNENRMMKTATHFQWIVSYFLVDTKDILLHSRIILGGCGKSVS